MPLQRCQSNGQSGWRWGASGKCYIGDGAKAKALRQGRAVEANKVTNMYQTLVTNLLPQGVRHDTLDGKDYIVVPCVMMTEGVHNGSNGPLYYPADELAKVPGVWNMKPIVVYHPTMNGQGISACDPVVLEKQSVGMLLNTRYDDKLRTEAWIDPAKANKVDPRVIDAIEASKMMEVSTGLFTENEKTEGEFDGTRYEAIARNHRPDHLALLPDKIGACSIADGAGLLQLNEDETKSFIQEQVHSFLDQEKATMAKKDLIDALITNEATQWTEDHREQLDGFEEDQLKLMSPIVVENADDEATKRKAEVDAAAKKGGAGAKTPEGDPPPVINDDKKTDPKPLTAEQYVENAPPEIRDLLNAGLSRHNQERTDLIASIIANEKNVFTKEHLETRSMDELKGIAALAQNEQQPEPSALFIGAGGGAAVINEGGEKEGLKLPQMEF